MNHPAELSAGNRAVALVLGVVWTLAGLGAGVYGLVLHRWPALLLSSPAVFYGFLWLRVARTGRQLRWPSRRG
jgi:hypothetical protein